MAKKHLSLRARRKRRKLTAVWCAIVALLIAGAFIYVKVTDFDGVAALEAVSAFFKSLPERLSQIKVIPEAIKIISEMSILQWIIAAVFFGIFIYFIRGVADPDLRKASIIWGITALFYGCVFVLMFSSLDLMETGLFFVLVAVAELLALINCMVVGGLGFFGSIFCTYLQMIVLLPVGAILWGGASYAQEQGHMDTYHTYIWLFQIAVFVVILGYQMLVFLPGGGGGDDGDPVKDMIGTEVDLSDWVDM